MAKAIEAGIPKLRIEEAAAKTQARIDSGQQTVIGVNKYRLTNEPPIDVLKVDNSAVRAQQIAKLKRLREERDQAATTRALDALTNGAKAGGNLLALSIDAARAKATIGEISGALEKVFGRHRAEIRAISGVYKREAGVGAETIYRVQSMVEAFEENEGRRPRILVAKVGQDGHETWSSARDRAHNNWLYNRRSGAGSEAGQQDVSARGRRNQRHAAAIG